MTEEHAKPERLYFIDAIAPLLKEDPSPPGWDFAEWHTKNGVFLELSDGEEHLYPSRMSKNTRKDLVIECDSSYAVREGALQVQIHKSTGYVSDGYTDFDAETGNVRTLRHQSERTVLCVYAPGAWARASGLIVPWVDENETVKEFKE